MANPLERVVDTRLDIIADIFKTITDGVNFPKGQGLDIKKYPQLINLFKQYGKAYYEWQISIPPEDRKEG